MDLIKHSSYWAWTKNFLYKSTKGQTYFCIPTPSMNTKITKNGKSSMQNPWPKPQFNLRTTLLSGFQALKLAHSLTVKDAFDL